MTKQRLKRAIVCCILFCLCLSAVLPLGVRAADGATTYVIGFRPGANGSFTDGAVAYLNNFGTVQQSAAGNLFVEVAAGTPFPTNIVSYLQADSGYYYKGGFTGAAVQSDLTCVAQYGILQGEGVLYTVTYADAANGAQLAEPYWGYANVGDTISFSAKTIDGYHVDSADKTLTVSDGAVLRFVYTSDGSGDNTHYVYGENTIVTQPTQQAGANPPANQQPDQAPNQAQPDPQAPQNTPEDQTDNGTDTDTVTIPDNQIPLDDGTQTIPDEEVPLAAKPNASKTIVYVVIGAGVLLLAVLLLLLLRRHKRIR